MPGREALIPLLQRPSSIIDEPRPGNLAAFRWIPEHLLWAAPAGLTLSSLYQGGPPSRSLSLLLRPG